LEGKDELNDTRTLVRDLMTVGVDTCKTDTGVLDLARLMLRKNLEALVVLDEEGCAQGVISLEELTGLYNRFSEEGQATLQGLTAAAIMREGVPQVPPDIPLTAAAQMMRDQGVRAVFLMHHAGGIEYPAGVLTYTHLIRHMAAVDAAELSDLGIRAERTSPMEAFIKRRDDARKNAGRK
jgi:CBS-domain-containing membrane protein